MAEQVTIVGAGPATLAVAACLEAARDLQHFDARASSIGSAWRGHYERLQSRPSTHRTPGDGNDDSNAPVPPLEVDPAAEASWSLESLRYMLTGKKAADLAAELENGKRVAWLVPAILHALKLIVGLAILWWSAHRLHVDPFWAYISMIVVGSETTGTLPAFLTRVVNTLIGCTVGLLALLAFAPSLWSLCLALAIVVLICSAFLGPPTRWKIAPITTVIVMGSAVVERSRSVGIDNGVRRMVAVLAGSALGLLISMAFSRIENWPRRSGESQL